MHILCDNEDIPKSPYMAQILPKTDYSPENVKVYGPGIDEIVVPKQVKLKIWSKCTLALVNYL